MRVYNQEFLSSEHVYQWRFLTYIGMLDLADEVLKASSAAEAKAIALRVPPHLKNDWHSIKKWLCERSFMRRRTLVASSIEHYWTAL